MMHCLHLYGFAKIVADNALRWIVCIVSSSCIRFQSCSLEVSEAVSPHERLVTSADYVHGHPIFAMGECFIQPPKLCTCCAMLMYKGGTQNEVCAIKSVQTLAAARCCR